MAREVGLRAVYVDVTTIERISREAEVIVNNGHITGGFVYGPDVIVIDFTRTPEREYLGYKVIDDLEAIANFYNNQGFLYGYFTEIARRPTWVSTLRKKSSKCMRSLSRSSLLSTAPATTWVWR